MRAALIPFARTAPTPYARRIDSLAPFDSFYAHHSDSIAHPSDSEPRPPGSGLRYAAVCGPNFPSSAASRYRRRFPACNRCVTTKNRQTLKSNATRYV